MVHLPHDALVPEAVDPPPDPADGGDLLLQLGDLLLLLRGVGQAALQLLLLLLDRGGAVLFQLLNFLVGR